MFNIVRKEFQYGDTQYVLETGKIARQATAAVMVTAGETSVLVTVVAKKEADPGKDFFPLTVNYQEKTYAAGRIPGGFFKREGRPSEQEILTCRLIDRPVRPLFPEGFYNEVQVMATVMSTDKKSDPDIAAMIGASAALSLSGIPFKGPIGAARVGYIDGMYTLNPGFEDLKKSELDLVVAGTDSAVLMVESEAKGLTEDQMLGAVLYGHQEMQKVITIIKEMVQEANVQPWDWAPAEKDTALEEKVAAGYNEAIAEAYKITDKQDRYAKLGELRSAAVGAIATEADDAPAKGDVTDMFGSLEKRIVRDNILSGMARIDGRAHDEIRPIEIEVGILPQVHGSALFTRGETQAIVVATLGGTRDSQMIDALEGTRTDNFMLHYNFPPYCVGEVGMALAPKRREIGHGRLARRGVQAILPDAEDFPYALRVVSEITESNGSSSMASACGTSLALMDAGVKVKMPVAGIAMGLVKEGDRFAVLSDILGDEDHLGDMDFKVVGSAEGITALQMDIKIEGITEEIMEKALNQARAGRLHILGKMNAVIEAPRENLSDTAPTYETLQINPDKIRDVIGKGGATIRALCEETGATIDIDDNGLVKIYGEGKAASDEALRRVKEIVAEPEVGKIYDGKITQIKEYGAFVNIMPGIDGLLHISQIAEERVENVTDYLSDGQELKVKVIGIDGRGKIKLSKKEVDAPQA